MRDDMSTEASRLSVAGLEIIVLVLPLVSDKDYYKVHESKLLKQTIISYESRNK